MIKKDPFTPFVHVDLLLFFWGSSNQLPRLASPAAEKQVSISERDCFKNLESVNSQSAVSIADQLKCWFEQSRKWSLVPHKCSPTQNAPQKQFKTRRLSIFLTTGVFSTGGFPSNTKTGFMSCSRKVSVRKKSPVRGLWRRHPTPSTWKRSYFGIYSWIVGLFFFFNSTGVCIFSDKYFSKISHLKEGVAARNWFRTTEASKAMTFPAVEYSGSAMNMKLHKSY